MPLFRPTLTTHCLWFLFISGSEEDLLLPGDKGVIFCKYPSANRNLSLPKKTYKEQAISTSWLQIRIISISQNNCSRGPGDKTMGQPNPPIVIKLPSCNQDPDRGRRSGAPSPEPSPYPSAPAEGSDMNKAFSNHPRSLL
ncbi:hypothetical protein F4781DRAFT_432664 [Annulohypoxylon bovei var. microspora]|nr:hypothetical protein F4781DRAFT_432664 [Annulohypoxylon bovei var. microspora]